MGYPCYHCMFVFHASEAACNDMPMQEPGKIFLVLEHCGGGDLAAYLRRYGRLREGPARFLLIQLAEGLKALRANNVIHVSMPASSLT